MKITKRLLKKLDSMSRDQLKMLHIFLTGDNVFALKQEILERTREALCEYLNIDV